MLLIHSMLAGAFFLVLLAPAWWLAGSVLPPAARPFFRLLCAVGFTLVGFVSFVNLLGRVIHQSIVSVVAYVAFCVIATVILRRRFPEGFRLTPLWSTWRSWIGPVFLAAAFGFPQWLLAVSTNYWDEVLPSGIYLTGINQFADGLFPPRHNAFPEITIKYHYAFHILAGTLKWLTGLSANFSIDIVSTALWLFVFLFVWFWLRELEFDALVATWGGFAVLLSGGFSYLYLGRLESYKTGGFTKVPATADLVHKYDPAKGWLANIVDAAQVPSTHLRNGDGSLSNLPWDIAGQFQQHAVSAGIAMTVFALFLLVTWQRRKEFNIPLAAATIAAFGVLFLGHAVFGGVGFITAALCLLGAWLRQRTWIRFLRGAVFGAAAGALALLHGGMLTRGLAYGTGSFSTIRKSFGYASGGIMGFVNWNLAGFGVTLLLALAAWALHLRRRDGANPERRALFVAASVFTLFSYFVPHTMFYSSETSGIEQFTEISKFFFCTHLGLALLSVFGVAYTLRRVHWGAVAAAFPLAAVMPLAFCYAGSFDAKHHWTGLYRSPYEYIGGKMNVEVQMGEALGRLKKSNRDVFYDASQDERIEGYLSGLLMYAGSVFTLTPSAFERNGVGFRLSEQVVAAKLAQSSRMGRLLPGAPEGAGCSWYYGRPVEDMALDPVIVRSRFDKLVGDGYFVKRHQVGARALFSIDKPTLDLDDDLELHWQPKIVAQTRCDRDADGKSDLMFLDALNRRILVGSDSIRLPKAAHDETIQLYVAQFPGDARADFLVGRLDDTYYRMGKKIEDVEEHNRWMWTYRDSRGGAWQPEYARWYWDYDFPILADLDHDGFAEHVCFRARGAEWWQAPDKKIDGPVADVKDLPLPFAGRFLQGSTGDLGVWCLKSGTVSIRSATGTAKAEFRWGGRPGDILVPGDYDGDGYDEIAVWQRTNQTWYWRHAPDGPIVQVAFGTPTSIPVPFDYNHDGKLDLAYWEPREGKIFVSFSQGRSVDLIVPVPHHGIPAFVNWY